MKLYTKPGACSTAVHIVLEWTGQPYEFQTLTATEMKSAEYLAINPAGVVPALTEGEFSLTQNAAIMNYVAEGAPAAGLHGDGSREARAEAGRWLAYVNSDVHPAFKPIFGPALFIDDENQFDAVRARAARNVLHVLGAADKRLADREWLAGFRSPADAYLYITLRWATFLKIDFSAHSNLVAFKRRMDADAGVIKALEDEGLKVI